VLVKLKFLGEEFYLVVPPIHPPLGSIKVLSMWSIISFMFDITKPASVDNLFGSWDRSF
jgi:hypothetical protein